MSNPTANMSLQVAADTDNLQTYFESALGASLTTIDGHDHSTNAKGVAVGRIVSGVDTNKPTSSPTTGTMYFATDSNKLYVGNGSSLVQVNAPVDITDTPAPIGTAATGSSTTASPADHVHALSYVGTITTSTVGTLQTDVSITGGTGSWASGPSVSLPKGTWLVVAKAQIVSGSYVGAARLFDGTLVYDAADAYGGNNGTLPVLALMAFVTNSSASTNLTVTLQGMVVGASTYTGTIKAQNPFYPNGVHATYVRAVRIA